VRHPGATLLLTLWTLLLPGAARAALGIDALDLEVGVHGTNGQDTSFAVTITITGTDLEAATLTRQGATALSLPCSGGTTCTATQGLPNQAALDTLLPTTATTYTLELKQGTDTITDTLSFARPVVPSPLISAPLAGSIISPGALDVTFSGCSTCSPTQGFLLQGATQIEEKLDLPAASTSWKPLTELAPESDFSVEIVHVAIATASLVADGPAPATNNDSYTFTTTLVHGDSVAFSTGFAPPVGDFCIAVNDAAGDALDPAGCTIIVEPAAGILDTSDSCSLSAAGLPIQYDLQLAPNGRLSGIADADLDVDGSFETHGTLVGRLRGKEGSLRQQLRVGLRDDSADARLGLRVREQANLATLVGAPDPPLEWLIDQRLRGKLAGTKIVEATTGLRTLPALPSDDIACAGGTPRTGWKLAFTLTGTEGLSSGSLQLANGNDVALEVKQRFDFVTNQTLLRLQSRGADAGVKILIRRLEIDDVPDPAQIASGVLRFRAFGQGGNLLLPPQP